MSYATARNNPRYAEAYTFYFSIRDASGQLITGWTGADSEISVDDGAFADCTNEATEIGTSGVGYLELTAAEMYHSAVTVKITVSNSGAVPVIRHFNLLGFAATIIVRVPPLLLIPSSGSIAYRITASPVDDYGRPSPTTLGLTIDVKNILNTSRSANLNSTTMGAGDANSYMYQSTYTVASTHATEFLKVLVTATIRGNTYTFHALTLAAPMGEALADIAQEVLKTDVGDVEATAAADSLAGLVLAAFHGTTEATIGKLTTYRQDGTTIFAERDLTTNADADPVTGIS